MKHTDTELERVLEQLVAATRSPRGRFSAGESWLKLEKRLPRKRRYPLSIRIFSAAATVALLCIIGWFAYEYVQPISMQTISTLAETKTVRLPDGTKVTLNHFSTLTYPERFKQTNRMVDLNGEAYFEVSKDKKHPFIVQTKAVDVQVLGTHFNVEAYNNDPEIKTTLFEGSVAVSNKSNSERIVLLPNESAIYNKVSKSLVRETTESALEEIAWQKGSFIFNNLPLREIARQLSNSFGVTIHINDTALQNYRITASFNNKENLESILRLLQRAGNFDYSQNTKQVTITTKSN